MDSVTVKELIDAVGLTVYSGDKHLEDRKIATDDISRPGLELTGYFDYYPQERVQLFGMTEISYAHKMDPEERLEVMDKLCGENTPCFVVSRYLSIPVEMEKAAEKHGIPILRSKLPTTRLSAKMTDYLGGRLAERKSLHGVLVDIA